MEDYNVNLVLAGILKPYYTARELQKIARDIYINNILIKIIKCLLKDSR